MNGMTSAFLNIYTNTVIMFIMISIKAITFVASDSVNAAVIISDSTVMLTEITLIDITTYTVMVSVVLSSSVSIVIIGQLSTDRFEITRSRYIGPRYQS